MNNFFIAEIFLLMAVFHLPCKASVERKSLQNIVMSSFTSSSQVSNQASNLSIEAYAITTDVCNMSLIESIENESALYKNCACNDELGDVDCSYLGITQLPKLISFPKIIQIANFRGNGISSLAPENFYNGHDVIELDLSNNKIDFISKSALRNFKKLMWLDLSHNRIWYAPKTIFEGLHNLRRLDMSFNRLIYLSYNHFANLTQLRDLNLKFNPLQDLNFDSFVNLVNLESLNLESTMLKQIQEGVFNFNYNLRMLNLADNKLHEMPTATLKNLHKLKVLDLSGNLIRIIHQESFKGLKVLEKIYLDRLPHLKTIENYAFGNLIHLQELHCSYNLMLSTIGPHAFAGKNSSKMASPSLLIFRQNHLKRIPHSLLRRYYDVQLDLRDNPLHCDCHIAWMMHTDLKNNFLSRTKCYSPPEYRNIALKDLKGKILRCDLLSSTSSTAWIVCSMILILTTVLLVLLFLILRCKHQSFSKSGFFRIKKKDIEPIDYYGRDDEI